MKRLVGILLVVAFDIFAIANAIHNFISSDGFQYFGEHPRRLLLVAVIGLAGGLVAFAFSVLSPGLQRRVKLVVLGFGAGFVMLAGGYLSFQVASLAVRLDQAIPRRIPWLLLLGTIGVTGLLWFEFYQALKKRVI